MRLKWLMGFFRGERDYEGLPFKSEEGRAKFVKTLDEMAELSERLGIAPKHPSRMNTVEFFQWLDTASEEDLAMFRNSQHK